MLSPCRLIVFFYEAVSMLYTMRSGSDELSSAADSFEMRVFVEAAQAHDAPPPIDLLVFPLRAFLSDVGRRRLGPGSPRGVSRVLYLIARAHTHTPGRHIRWACFGVYAVQGTACAQPLLRNELSDGQQRPGQSNAAAAADACLCPSAIAFGACVCCLVSFGPCFPSRVPLSASLRSTRDRVTDGRV